MRKRILSCNDYILDDKYFILTRFMNKLLQTYFYNEVEEFFLNILVNNKELLTLESFDEYYLNDENYKIFKIIYYEDILIELEKINNLFKILLKDFNIINENKYNIEDFYICLDYIQERSIYLNLYEKINNKEV